MNIWSILIEIPVLASLYAAGLLLPAGVKSQVQSFCIFSHQMRQDLPYTDVLCSCSKRNPARSGCRYFCMR